MDFNPVIGVVAVGAALPSGAGGFGGSCPDRGPVPNPLGTPPAELAANFGMDNPIDEWDARTDGPLRQYLTPGRPTSGCALSRCSHLGNHANVWDKIEAKEYSC